FLEHRTVQEYADRLAISPGHLNDSVRNACGKSAKDMIQEQLVLEAKRMLYHSNYSIKEIAVHLGFDDPSYFNRFF
ncbi:MAG: helix-turn-helix domain-containing protein, partial [Pirellula sp.]